MDRLKRVINKPQRYQTTSSDEDEKRPKRKRNPAPSSAVDLDDDIDDIRAIIEQNENSTFNIQPRITQTDTQIQQYTGLSTRPTIISDTGYIPQKLPHINTEHVAHIETYTNIPYSPQMQTYINTGQRYTNIGSSSNTQTHTNTTNNTNFTLHTEHDKTYYLNKILLPLQEMRSAMAVQQHPGLQQRESQVFNNEYEGYTNPYVEETAQKGITNNEKIMKRLDDLDTEMK
ncbi:uncharacterized protein LOC116853590 [Odontomachus brunneus]|uniref:uncharacterized protein LOC116853590 n=1 Tax=Odontomachus brunneus TaxID=486640 RepID=UPI0013F24610|nr:uncharacterized protein LOC116853590 [Odontomachus brunneus]XP_032690606.1 uncharacterized protein LOC116853590 [Odontomachus brunneus]XP_032690607.1 uncharacterized protein LOC116853590 [Odontomachus brunneus]